MKTLHALAGASLLAFTACVPAIAEDSARLLFTAPPQPFPADSVAASTRPLVAGEPLTQPVTAAGPALDPVETAALYYYARQRQTDRVEAEIARLQVLHPGFVPPQDLYLAADAVVPDETSLWALFAADDFTGIDAEIIRRKGDDPAWEPTPDFQGKLARKKLRVRMSELAEAGDWLGLLDVSTGIDPASETDVDLVWMRIDALSAAGDRDGLARTLRGLLVREGPGRLSDEHLTVTLQKALRDFPASEIRILAAALWPNQSAEYLPGTLRLDMARKEIAGFNETKDAAAVSEDQLRLLSVEARNSRRPEDLSLLGWHDLKAGQPAAAEEWFSFAMEAAPDPENAKGMYLSLYRQGDETRAYDFAASHLPDLSDDPVFLMNVLSPRFGKPEAGAPSEEADHAEILGWYAYNSRQFEAAEAWFRQSYGWEASPDRLKGLALSLLRRDRKKDYAALKAEFGDIYPDIWPEIAAAPAPKARKAASVGEPAAGVSASYIRHLEARNYPACLREIDRLGQAAAKPQVAVVRGWCELGLKRFGAARSSFESAMAGSGQVRLDAVYGAGLAMLGARLTDEAEALIAAWPLSDARARELKSEIYLQRARSSFDHKQYERTLAALDARTSLVAEPRDLTQLRAWAHYHLGRTARAKAIFAELNMVMRDQGSLAALGVINNQEGR
jgi:cellulose synthase operon protein C